MKRLLQSLELDEISQREMHANAFAARRTFEAASNKIVLNPSGGTLTEGFMKAIIIAVAFVAATSATIAVAAQNAPAMQNHRYFTMPLEKDPTREVGLQAVDMPPGAGNE